MPCAYSTPISARHSSTSADSTRSAIEYAQGIYVAVPESVEALSRITRTAPHLRLARSA